jgi:hypothetical protein
LKGVDILQAYSEFGIKARTVMLQKSMTMTALAKELKISRAYVSDIFLGLRQAPKQKKRIAEFLGLNEKDEQFKEQ